MSICIPAYNQPASLRRALESIRIQTFQDYEVIVTDDSTSDGVEEAAKTYLDDPRFRYVRNRETMGTPGNWNEAIRHARSDLVKLLHHDDWFSGAHSLRAFVDLLEAEPSADFAFCASNVHDSAGKLLWLHAPTESQLAQLRTDPLCLLGGNFVGAPSATIFRKRTAPAFDENMKWLVDIDFYIALLRRHPRFAYADSPLVSICFSEDQVSEAYRRSAVMQLKEHVYLYQKLEGGASGLAYTWKYIIQASRLLEAGASDEELGRCDFVQHPDLALRVALLLARIRARARAARASLRTVLPGR